MLYEYAKAGYVSILWFVIAYLIARWLTATIPVRTVWDFFRLIPSVLFSAALAVGVLLLANVAGCLP